MLKKLFKDLLSVLLISFISFALISCEGIFTDHNFTNADSAKDFITKDGKIIVKGNVDLQGAVPENMAKTAMPDFSSITYVVTATPSEGEAVKATALSDGSFSIELYPGSYSVKVEGYKTADTEKKILLKGKYINAATEDLLSVTGDGVTGLSLSVSPVISAAPGEDLYGTVNLSIGLTDSIIKSWKATWTEDGTSVEKKQSSTSAVNSINFNLVADGQTDVNKKVGSYYVTFELFSEENYVSPVLVFSEMINVFENADTSMWVSHGASDFINADGTMTIAKTQLENRVNYYVNQTTGSSSNPGSYFQPLDNIQDAVDRIKAQNDGSKTYTIYVCSDYKISVAPTAANKNSVLYISNSSGKALNINLKSYGSTKYKIDCNNLDARSIYASSNNSTSSINLTLENIQLCNANTDMGGGICVGNYTTVNLNDGTAICNNKCSSAGGAVVIVSANGSAVLNIDGGEIYSNRVDGGTDETGHSIGDGGAIYCVNGTLNFNRGMIGSHEYTKGNFSKHGGGGVYLSANSIFNQNGGYIKYNEAEYGAGVFVESETSTFNMTDGYININNALYGGAIYQLDGVCTLSGGDISSNITAHNMSNGVFLGQPPASGKFILKDEIIIQYDDDILSFFDAPVYIGGDLLNDNSITVWFYTDDAADNPDGKKILANVDSTDYVKDNYSKFEYKYADDYIIDNKGIVRDKNATPSIASLKPAGVTLPSSSFTLPDSPKELTLSTAAELKQLSLWSKSSKLIGYSFTMTDDIDLESADDFVPIGSHNNAGEVFEGIFDGNGFEIKNLYVNTPSASNSGLFGKCQDALIKNLTVSGEVTAKDYVGGIVGSIYIYQSPPENYGIQNCVSYVNVSGTNSAGGVVGHVLDCKVSKCVNFGTVTSVRSAGISATSLKGNFSECVNFGTIKGISNSTGEDAAGIIGKITEGGNSNISSCYNAGTIIKPADSQATGTDLNYAFLVGKGTTALTSSNNYYLNSSLQFKGAAGFNDTESTFCRTTYDFFKNNLSSNAPFNSWTDTVTYNGQTYIVPVACKNNYNSYEDISGYSACPDGVRDFAIRTDSDLRKLSTWAQSSNLTGYNFYVPESFAMTATSFTPIGSSSKKFCGNFNGLGNVINNLIITGNSDYSSLFGYVDKGVIENIVVTGTVSGGKYSAGIVSYLGSNYSSGIVRNCVSYVDVTSNGTTSKSGGICGYQLNGTIEKCVNLGTVSGSGDNLGGITGYVEKGTVKYCVNLGTIDCKGNANLCAGITGQNYNINASSIEVSYCYNAGEIVNPKANTGVFGYITSQYIGNLKYDFYLNNSSTIKGFSKVNSSDPDPNENHEGIIKKETLSVIKNNTAPFNTWTNTITVNGESYPVPVRCPVPVNNADPIGSLSAPVSVGDFVFFDGTASPKTAVLTDEQKSKVAGIVFTTTYNSSTGSNTTGSTILMVGIHNSGDDYFTSMRWYDDDHLLYRTQYSGISDCDGSINWGVAKTVDYNGGNTPGTYPAFEWANEYGSYNVNSSTLYKTGWYLPSIKELDALNATYEIVNEGIDMIDPGLMGISTAYTTKYWSSTPSEDNEKVTIVYTYNFDKNSSFELNKLESDKLDDCNVLAIRRVN